MQTLDYGYISQRLSGEAKNRYEWGSKHSQVTYQNDSERARGLNRFAIPGRRI